MKNNILNIINFVRASEPRSEDDSFLLTTFKREVDLCVEYNFPATFLFQYDSLVLPEYTDYIKTVFPDAQTGLWFETVGQLVKKCGIEWRGRNDWDWHNDVGFLIGYTPKEREKLIDEAFDEYKNVFGKFPSVIGSWHIDAYSLNYISKKYHVDAACICKEQTGTDGYTLWGGVYSGAYFPSVNNMLCPAQTRENQTDIPVFRMLGSDPIAQYENGIDTENKHQAWTRSNPSTPSRARAKNGCAASSKTTITENVLRLPTRRLGRRTPSERKFSMRSRCSSRCLTSTAKRAKSR